MRFNLIPVFLTAVVLNWVPTASADTGLDSFLILAEETEKKKVEEDDKNKGAGDDEPECE